MEDQRRHRPLSAVAAMMLFGAWAVAAEDVRYGWDDVSRWLPDLAVGAGWATGAAVLLARPAVRRAGLLMAAFATTWFVGNFAAVESSVPAALAAQGTYLHRGILAHLVLTFPNGGRLDLLSRATLGAAYGVSMVPGLARSTVASVIVAGLTVAAAGVRLRGSYGHARRPRVVALVAAVAVCVALAGAAVVRAVLPAGDEIALTAYQVVLVLVGGLLAAAALRTLRPDSVVTDVAVELADGPRAEMTRALAHALGDPTVRVGYWSPDRAAFIDASGACLPVEARHGRVVSVVRAGSDALLALDHDAATTATIDVSGALEQAAGLMTANARLHVELRRRVDEVTAARLRLVQAEARERRRLERQLQAGAGRQLQSLRAWLTAARRAAGQETAQEVDVAMAQLDLCLGDLRRLAGGLYPSLLASAGLKAALQEMTSQAALRVSLNVDDVIPTQVQDLGYFICAEALANVAKHAQATSASVTVRADAERMSVEVVDDGVGIDQGHARPGLGLRSLADRVAAYGGAVACERLEAGGTRVAAEVPLRRSGVRVGGPAPASVVSRPSPSGDP